MSPRNEEQNKQLRDERREQILQSALKVFAKRGFAATKISDIKSAAGLSHGLVYHYFSSKDEIFSTLVERALEGSKMVVDYASQQKLSPLGKIKWMTEKILKEMSEDGAYYNLITIQAFTSDAVPEQIKSIINDKSPNALEGILPIIKAGQKSAEIVHKDPVKLAALYFAVIQGIAMQQLQGNKIIPTPDVELILRIFKT
ncbi:TetR/AcrR family transcriptional regulator [Pseudalkalibacillus salsuginis]|uniref:TetR/AcrR family transcriptional regulator n=1 Tax=Pseudalkalibacillus salsuginis TaxID=2910972 RepID=UPI001F3EDFDA|nr:TetR/AcrR family transcriptional regulator [Pseudalkalibacillus salsuginis]MCF6411733.1 TetR/AcrR family transcriptional regulator [Pseudalkalibacillus salsuginis]